MARLWVWEWACGGGQWRQPTGWSEDTPFFREGVAMLRALIADARQAGWEVSTLVDARWLNLPPEWSDWGVQIDVVHSPQELAAKIRESSAGCEQAAGIAPENEGELLWLDQQLSLLQLPRLSPTGEFLQLACSKHATSERLRQRGVQDLAGVLWRADTDAWPPAVAPPVILKPDDGAGGTQWRVRRDYAELLTPPTSGWWRVESWLSGESYSLSALSRPSGTCWLEPSRQILEPRLDGVSYIASELPVPSPVRQRLWDFADRLLPCLPTPQGYWGMDLVYDPRTEQVTVVDINPRFTTSYLALRRFYPFNLVQALVADTPLEIGIRLAQVPRPSGC